MSIFTHMFVGTNDVERARTFYDQVLGTLGIKRVLNLENASGWGTERPEFLVIKPIDGKPATHANGGTIGFAAPSRKSVHEFHKAALSHGGTDEGAPGPRSHIAPTAYAAYVRDPDGNNFAPSATLRRKIRVTRRRPRHRSASRRGLDEPRACGMNFLDREP